MDMMNMYKELGVLINDAGEAQRDNNEKLFASKILKIYTRVWGIYTTAKSAGLNTDEVDKLNLLLGMLHNTLCDSIMLKDSIMLSILMLLK